MSLAEEPVVLAPQITESETAWSFQKLRGGRSNSDADRILMFCLILVFCGALVTGVVGTTLYVVKSNANSQLRVTRCEVLSMYMVSLHCGKEKCTDNVDGQPKCDIEISECYAPQWRVGYPQVDSEGEIIPHGTVNAWIIDSPFATKQAAEVKMKEHAVGTKAVCNYHSSDPNYVQWGYDDPEPWLIAMIVSWCVVGLFLCVLGFGWFFSTGDTGV